MIRRKIDDQKHNGATDNQETRRKTQQERQGTKTELEHNALAHKTLEHNNPLNNPIDQKALAAGIAQETLNRWTEMQAPRKPERPADWMLKMSHQQLAALRELPSIGPDHALRSAFGDRGINRSTKVQIVEIPLIGGIHIAKAELTVNGRFIGGDFAARPFWRPNEMLASEATTRHAALSATIERLFAFENEHLSATPYPNPAIVQTEVISDIPTTNRMGETRLVEYIKWQNLYKLANAQLGGPENWRIDINANAECWWGAEKDEAILLCRVSATLEQINGMTIKDEATEQLTVDGDPSAGIQRSQNILNTILRARETAIQRVFAALGTPTGGALLSYDFHTLHPQLPESVLKGQELIDEIEAAASALTQIDNMPPRQFINQWISQHGPHNIHELARLRDRVANADRGRSRLERAKYRGLFNPHRLGE